MIRTGVGVQALGAASQPVFGTVMNGASVMTMDKHTLNTKPASQNSVSVIPVASTVGFRVGDRVLIAPKANFIYQGNQDQGFVNAVNPGVSISVEGLLVNHASGEYVVIGEDAATVTIQAVVSTNPIYLGNASTVSAADPSVFYVINAPAAANYKYESPNVLADSLKTSEYWVFGTAADTIVGSYTQA